MRRRAPGEADLIGFAQIRPVLVDVGASGSPPDIWREVAPISHYVGFDPDLREIHDEHGREFARSTMVDKAVSHDPDVGVVEFKLTRSPFCSSVLEPDLGSLDAWSIRALFDVVERKTVDAVTLDVALDDLGVSAMDWLKLDTQGTDLRLLQGLSPARLEHLVALDAEPGLIDAYQGEDLFVDLHREVTAAGFWLSALTVKGGVRLHANTRANVGSTLDDEDRVVRGTRSSPGWCEARYLRTVESLSWDSPDHRDALLLWAFSMLDGQYGAALDVATEWRRRLGQDVLVTKMERTTLARVGPGLARGLRSGVRRHMPERMKRHLRSALSRD